MENGYSPYAARKFRQKPRLPFGGLRLPSLRGGWKKWPVRIGGALLLIFLVFYLWLGDLRFFATHFLRLSFFSKHYLILLQNNYELRPGGGFITAYGNLDFFMGFPTRLSFQNSYEIDTANYVTPPYPHEELLKNEWYQGYTFRDANFDPDFPESAKTLIDFYQGKFPEEDVDGIIVINFKLIENLADAFGGVELDGKTLTGHNLFSELEFAVNNVDRHDETALASRKNVLAELAAALTDEIKWNPGKTRWALARALREKDLYLWLRSPGLQRRLVKRGWANALALPPESDFLAVNVANLGAKKADRYMWREVHHAVNLSHEVPEVRTEVTLRFPGDVNAYSDHYKGYVRVVLPGAATLRESPPDSVTEPRGDLLVIGTKIVLPAGSKTTLSYTYTLPRTLFNPDEYRLRLVRQSGSEARYSVTVETPPDTFVTSADFEGRENRGFFEEKLLADRDLLLRVAPDTTPPYPVEQVFTDLNTVLIHWSEPIDPGPGSDAINYTIQDANVTDPAADDAKVVYAEVTDSSVSRLELEGVTRQNLERYKIEIRNMRDLAGNAMMPDPRVITAVQRYAEPAPVNAGTNAGVAE